MENIEYQTSLTIMRKQFLVGNFLRAYSDSFRYAAGSSAPRKNWDSNRLKSRFGARAARSRDRNHRYSVTLQLAVVLAIAIPLVAVHLDIRSGSGMMLTEVEQEVVTLQEIAQTMHQTLPPPPPRPSVPIEVPNDELPDDLDLDFDASLDLAAAVELPPPPSEATEEEEAEQEPEIFVVVEELPELIGGVAKLASDVQYPPMARQAGLEGLVIVKIVVNADGTPSDPVVLRSPGSALDKAAIEAVMKQQFRPGKQRGRAVAAYMAIPVRFQLTSS